MSSKNKDSELKTHYAIQRLIKEKKKIPYILVVFFIMVTMLVSVGFGVYIYSVYDKQQTTMKNFSYFSHKIYDIQHQIMMMSTVILQMDLSTRRTSLPEFSNLKSQIDFTLKQMSYCVKSAKDSLNDLKESKNSDRDAWLKAYSIIQDSKVRLYGQEVNFEKAIHQVFSHMIDLYNLEFAYPSSNKLMDFDKQIIKQTMIQQIQPVILEPFYINFEANLWSKIMQAQADITTGSRISNSGMIIGLLIFYALYFIALILIDIEFMKKLDKIVRLFYGFTPLDCQVIIRRCEKLVDSIQSAQFGNDVELVEEDDDYKTYQEMALPSADKSNGVDGQDLMVRRRKGKGSLVKVFSIKNLIILAILTGLFCFKYIMIAQNTEFINEMNESYLVSAQADQIKVLIATNRAWLERLVIDGLTGKEEYAKQSHQKLQDLWKNFQFVSFYQFSALLVHSNLLGDD